MAKTIKVDQLSSEIARILDEFDNATANDIESAAKDTAKSTVEELRNANPSGSGKYGSWKDYNRGWTSKKTSTSAFNGYTMTVYNKTKYQLTHLLEHGHAKVTGGRTKSFPHISIAEENAEKQFASELLRRLKK